jgi:hypothetical protein
MRRLLHAGAAVELEGEGGGGSVSRLAAQTSQKGLVGEGLQSEKDEEEEHSGERVQDRIEKAPNHVVRMVHVLVWVMGCEVQKIEPDGSRPRDGLHNGITHYAPAQDADGVLLSVYESEPA